MKAYCEYKGKENKLNPDALDDLYEALKSVLRMWTIVESHERDRALEALAKAEVMK